MLQSLNNPSLPGVDLSLTRMWELLAALGNPHEKLPPVIHVAGTNGKGSTIAFLRAMYEAAGLRVHAYTSPHLVRFNERIVIAGEEITDAVLLPCLQQVAAALCAIPVTFFEATTAAAFLAYAANPADVLLLEVGLGGRLDATNVVAKPIATVITPIGYDHMEFLGDTLAKIATEKGGMMKPGAPCFVGAQTLEALAALQKVADVVGASMQALGRDWSYEASAQGMEVSAPIGKWALPLPALIGQHQLHNAALASVVVRSTTALRVNGEAIAEGVRTAAWAGRLQLLSHGPLVEAWGARGEVYLDGGHNVHAAAMLAEWMVARKAPVTLLAGMMARKDAAAFFSPLAPHLREVITMPIAEEGSYSPEALAEAARRAGAAQVRTAKDDVEICAMLETAAAGTLLITGSLFLAGEILKNHG